MNSFAWVVATVAYAMSPQANTLRTSKKNEASIVRSATLSSAGTSCAAATDAM